MSPVSSASGMKDSGAVSPCVGCARAGVEHRLVDEVQFPLAFCLELGLATGDELPRGGEHAGDQQPKLVRPMHIEPRHPCAVHQAQREAG
ncbi:hypothetical protein, partial [Sphaerotilus sp.]|uniref:hypothetical protein n=1 Tax=Sphaerotilus sp. TaxID=2093942 RepID=UPI0034E29095